MDINGGQWVEGPIKLQFQYKFRIRILAIEMIGYFQKKKKNYPHMLSNGVHLHTLRNLVGKVTRGYTSSVYVGS